MKTACKIETTAWFSPRRDFPEPGRKPTDELHRYKAREHDRVTEDLQRRWALQRPKRIGKIYKRKNTTSANNHYYISSNRHARTLWGSKYSDTDIAPQLTSKNTDGQNVTNTWQTERLERKDCEKLPFVWGIVPKCSCICEAQAWDTVGGSLSRVVHGKVRKRNIQRLQICEGLSSKKRAGTKLQSSNGGKPLRVKCFIQHGKEDVP